MHEPDELARAAIGSMCSFLGQRLDALVERWLLLTRDLLPQRDRVGPAIPEWWRELARQFLGLFVAHLEDPADLGCHRLVRLVTKLGFRGDYTAADLVCTQIALKRVLVSELVERLGPDSESLRIMCDRIESEIDHVRLQITESYYRYSEADKLRLEQRHWALFNSAGDAVLMVDPDNFEIIGANQEAHGLLGAEPGELTRTSLLDLFEDASRRQVRQTVLASKHEGSSVVDRIRLLRPDGDVRETRVRATKIRYGGMDIAQVTVRDETGLWARTEEGGDGRSREELKMLLAAHTRALSESRRKYRQRYREARQQIARMAVLQEIGESALNTRSVDDLLTQAAEAIRRYFRRVDISLYTLEDQNLVLRAHRGSFENAFQNGYHQSATTGLMGQAVDSLQPVVSGDVSRHPGFYAPFPVARRTRSELAVPVVRGGECRALIDAQSVELNAFDDGDVAILQAVAGQLAVALEKVSAHEQVVRTEAFFREIIRSFPASLVVLDSRDRVVTLNERFARECGIEVQAATGRPFVEVAEAELIEQVGFPELLAEVRQSRERVSRYTVHHWSPAHEDRFLNVRVQPLEPESLGDLVIVINNVTEATRGLFQRDLVYQVSELIQRAALDEDYVLHAALTCVTAGPALGFNRAFVLLANEDRTELRGRVAVGPADGDDAHRLYTNLANQPADLESLVAKYAGPLPPASGSLHERVREVRLPLEAAPKQCPIGQAFAQCSYRRVTRSECPPDCHSPELAALLDVDEFAIAALEAPDGSGAMGVILADNCFTRAPLGEEGVRLLAAVARQTGLALHNARSHAEMLRHQQLVAAGEMSARVSHEIRNPLVTIGGFARGILKQKEVTQGSRVHRNASIIVEEVDKLNNFLSVWLDLTRPPRGTPTLEDLNALMENALLLADIPDTVSVQRHLADALPLVSVDARRIGQALLNLVLNAVQAMEGQGQLTVRSEDDGDGVLLQVSDTGPGIPETVLERVFEPFFTTKLSGSGLGLAVTQATVKEHGGRLELESREGEGTTASLWLPKERPNGDNGAH